MRQRRRWLAAGWVLVASACAPITPPVSELCTPGETKACTCTSGLAGSSLCLENRSGFAECVCESTPCQTDAECTDTLPCTKDACRSGTCEHAPEDGLACDDGSKCTEDDACAGATCTGAPVVCANDDPCLAAECQPAHGCNFENAPDGTACDDGSACTLDEACLGGACTHATEIPCTASGPCRVPHCDVLTGACSETVAPDLAGCEDGDACTVGDYCQGSTCMPGSFKSCPTSSNCVVGTCAAGVCGEMPGHDGDSCNDGVACTDNDVCQGGVCKGTPTVCPAPAACEKAVTCQQGECVAEIVPGKPCDDGNACTVLDKCSILGACEPGSAIVCPKTNVCHEASCDPGSGCVATPLPVGTACDDQDECTEKDACDAGGACAGSTSSSPLCGGTCTAQATVLSELVVSGTGDGRALAIGKDGYVYLSTADPKVVVVNALDKTSPYLSTAYATLGEISAMRMHGGHLLVGTSGALQGYDLTDPANPVLAGSAKATQPYFIRADATGAYVADGTDGLRVYDVDDPLAPVLMAEITYKNFDARSAAMRDKWVYLGDPEMGLWVVDRSEPKKPLSQQIMGATGIQALQIQKTYLYAAAGKSGISVFSLADGAAPTLVTTLQLPSGTSATSLHGYGSWLFVGSDNASYLGVFFVSLANPTAPKTVEAVDTSAPWRLATSGSHLYYSFYSLGGESGGLGILSVECP